MIDFKKKLNQWFGDQTVARNRATAWLFLVFLVAMVLAVVGACVHVTPVIATGGILAGVAVLSTIGLEIARGIKVRIQRKNK